MGPVGNQPQDEWNRLDKWMEYVGTEGTVGWAPIQDEWNRWDNQSGGVGLVGHLVRKSRSSGSPSQEELDW